MKPLYTKPNKFSTLKILIFGFSSLILLFGNLCEGRPGSILTNGNEAPEEEEITYPFQQYIQVRHSYSVEHLPAYGHSNSEDEEISPFASTKSERKVKPRRKKKKSRKHSGLLTSASSNAESNSNDDNDHAHEYGQQSSEGDEYEQHSSHEYTKPRLTEEISDYKKQEVYEEKGHSDGAYDHKQNSYKGQAYYPTANHNDNSNYDYPSQEGYSDNPDSSSTNVRNNYRRRSPTYSRLHPPADGTSSKILEYAASNLYDRRAHELGSIYRARDNIYCPEVIDFDLSSKKMAMGQGGDNPRGAKPRLTGLGSKIKCLKEKYFSKEPLPSAIFLDPSESRYEEIELPSFDQFYRDVRKEVGSMSEFQH